MADPISTPQAGLLRGPPLKPAPPPILMAPSVLPMRSGRGLHPVIEVDGAGNVTAAAEAAAAGATAMVAGSAICGTQNYAAAIADTRANASAAAGCRP